MTISVTLCQKKTYLPTCVLYHGMWPNFFPFNADAGIYQAAKKIHLKKQEAVPLK